MDLKSVPIRVTSKHQPFYVPQLCLQCTNAFHQTAVEVNSLVDGLTGR